jgi:hypothetical protein
MKGKHLITEYNGYIKSREELDNLEYYNKYYIKDKHAGADSSCIYLDDKIKIKVYGVNDSDHTKDESGAMHVHIYTEFGESEYYVDYINKTITYKDGYKLSDEYVHNIHTKLDSESPVVPGTTPYSCIYMSWCFENQDNIKTITYHNNQH